jgi:hypothetical protein
MKMHRPVAISAVPAGSARLRLSGRRNIEDGGRYVKLDGRHHLEDLSLNGG